MSGYEMAQWGLRQWTHNFKGEETGVTVGHIAMMFGRSRQCIYNAMRKLKQQGLAAYSPTTRRWYPTAALTGVNRASWPAGSW